MREIKPHNKKYYSFYMGVAENASMQSVATRRQVGAAIILPSGLIATGWNGMPAGFDNICETKEVGEMGSYTKTKPQVIHAERNALDKLLREGVSPLGAILFVTTEPCLECAKSIASVGITSVIYDENYKNHDGTNHLILAGVTVGRMHKD
jgi:dCMP deaminase